MTKESLLLRNAIEKALSKNEKDFKLREQAFSDGWASGILIGYEQGKKDIRKQTLEEVLKVYKSEFAQGIRHDAIRLYDGMFFSEWLSKEIKRLSE